MPTCDLAVYLDISGRGISSAVWPLIGTHSQCSVGSSHRGPQDDHSYGKPGNVRVLTAVSECQ